MNTLFFLNSLLLGVGLAMDAFSVSLANGLNEPNMKKGKLLAISGSFGFFQFLMPMIGWLCVHFLLEKFNAFQKYIPWIALILLLYIGGKMIIDGIKNNTDSEKPAIGFSAIIIQSIATSIDALSVGFTIAKFDFKMAMIESIIIGLVTFIICIIGTLIGKKFGTKFSKSASIIGGVILIAIGLEIFIKGVFF